MGTLINRLALFGAACVVAALVYPIFASGPQLDRAAGALALAGPAAAAAISSAVGRPTLAAAALAGIGAYTSGMVAQSGVPVPLAIVTGGAMATAVAAAIALVCFRLEAPAFMVASLVIALAAGALVQALPGLTGAESGLGPIPPIQVPAGISRNAVATPVGDFHILLAVAAATAVVATLALRFGTGPAWRAIGSDRARASASGLSPLAGEVAALALGGLMAGLCGALFAHVSRLASPSSFTIDAAALPLLAALAAGRQPLEAVLVAVATGVVGQLILPAVGWHGPPDATSLALGLLAIATVATLLPGPAGGEAAATVEPVSGRREWPLSRLRLRGAALDVQPITMRSSDGVLLVTAPAFRVDAGQVRAIVGPNGSGKSTLLTALSRRAGRSADVVMSAPDASPRCLLMPQEGGGWAFCTVEETLVLAASFRRTPADARAIAASWLEALDLQDVAGQFCAALPAGRRRLVELARVLSSSPSVLLCDEPLAGLDDQLRGAAASCLRAAADASLTVIIAEHDRDAVALLADAVLTLQRVDSLDAAAPAVAT